MKIRPVGAEFHADRQTDANLQTIGLQQAMWAPFK